MENGLLLSKLKTTTIFLWREDNHKKLKPKISKIIGTSFQFNYVSMIYESTYQLEAVSSLWILFIEHLFVLFAIEISQKTGRLIFLDLGNPTNKCIKKFLSVYKCCQKCILLWNVILSLYFFSKATSIEWKNVHRWAALCLNIHPLVSLKIQYCLLLK